MLTLVLAVFVGASPFALFPPTPYLLPPAQVPQPQDPAPPSPITLPSVPVLPNVTRQPEVPGGTGDPQAAPAR